MPSSSQQVNATALSEIVLLLRAADLADDLLDALEVLAAGNGAVALDALGGAEAATTARLHANVVEHGDRRLDLRHQAHGVISHWCSGQHQAKSEREHVAIIAAICKARQQSLSLPKSGVSTPVTRNTTAWGGSPRVVTIYILLDGERLPSVARRLLY